MQDWIGIIERLARSIAVGITLGAIAVVMVIVQWWGTDLSFLSDIPARAYVLASLAYGLALLLFAYAGSLGKPGLPSLGGGLAAQLAKYVPGGIWQAQPLYVAGQGTSVVSFGATILLAASLALAVSNSVPLVVVGLALAVLIAGTITRKAGPLTAVRAVLVASGAVAAIAVSGAVLGSALPSGSPIAGREIVGAWGFGVLVIPVPAGLGVREFYLTLVDSTESAAALALSHRFMTVAVDVGLGALGLWFLRAKRKRSP